MIRTLLDVQWKILKNTIASNSTKGNVGYFVSVLVVVVVAILFSFIATMLPVPLPANVLTVLLSYLFMIILALQLLMGIPEVFKNLYASKDLNFLFTLPIKVRHIYWVKYIQSFIGTPFIIFILFFLPAVIYGIRANAYLFYYPVLLITLLSFLAAGLALAYFINMGLVQIIPAKRANELMTAMSAVSGLLVYFMFQLPNMIEVDVETEMLPSFPEWLPMSWASSAIIAALGGSSSFLMPMLLLVFIAVFLSFFASTLVEKGFRTGWIQLNEGKNKKKKVVSPKKSMSVRTPIIEIGLKEWRYLKRDVREWLIFMPFVFFFGFIGLGFFSSGADISFVMELDTFVSWMMVQIIVLLMFGFFNGSMAASAVVREGSASWILHILPIPGWQVALGKLWISWLLPWILLSVIEVGLGIVLGWSIWQFAAGLLINAIISAGVSAIGIWIGLIGGKSNPSNPQNRIQFGASILLIVFSYLYLFLTLIPLVLLVIPAGYNEFFYSIQSSMSGILGGLAGWTASLLDWKETAPVGVSITGIVLILLLSTGCSLLFLLLAAKQINRGIRIKGAE